MTCAEGTAIPDVQDLADVRAWLAAARRSSPQLEPALVARVEAEFVAARAADPSLSQAHLHAWLLVRGCQPLAAPWLTRLCCAACMGLWTSIYRVLLVGMVAGQTCWHFLTSFLALHASKECTHRCARQ